jgi:magnesium-transporting ATPase (P-type)
LFYAETAINIGYSCRLLVDEMEEIFVVDGDCYEVVESQLQKARMEMSKIMSEQNMDSHQENAVTFSNGRLGNKARKAEEFGGFALVVNGHSLVSVPFFLSAFIIMTQYEKSRKKKKIFQGFLYQRLSHIS